MKRLLISGAAVVAVLALAACGGGGGDSSNSPDATPSSNGTTTVSVEEIGDAGRVLVDSAGQALSTHPACGAATRSEPCARLPPGP